MINTKVRIITDSGEERRRHDLGVEDTKAANNFQFYKLNGGCTIFILLFFFKL